MRQATLPRCNMITSVLAMATGILLQPEEVAAVRKCFTVYDHTGSGLIDVKELGNAMAQLGMELPEEHFNKLQASFAEDNTRLMDLQTFMQLMSQQKTYMLSPPTHTQLAWLGLNGNEDYSGTVSVRRLKEKLKALESEWPDMDTFLQDRGVDSEEGMLSWGDFHALLKVEGDEGEDHPHV